MKRGHTVFFNDFYDVFLYFCPVPRDKDPRKGLVGTGWGLLNARCAFVVVHLTVE